MIISGVTLKQLYNALDAVNEKYQGNVTWNCEPVALNKAGTRWRFTLRVKSSKGPGHGLAYGTFAWGRKKRLVSACWHVHGYFFDALPAGAKVHSMLGDFETGTEWRDKDRGSRFCPVLASELCECGGEVEASNILGEFLKPRDASGDAKSPEEGS